MAIQSLAVELSDSILDELVQRRKSAPGKYDPISNTFDEETDRINKLICERILLNRKLTKRGR